MVLEVLKRELLASGNTAIAIFTVLVHFAGNVYSNLEASISQYHAIPIEEHSDLQGLYYAQSPAECTTGDTALYSPWWIGGDWQVCQGATGLRH